MQQMCCLVSVSNGNAFTLLLKVLDVKTAIAIANGTCVSFCNQPKAHFGLPWVCPWDNRGKFYMDGQYSMLVKRIAACTHLS